MAKTFRIKGQVGGRFAQMIAVDDSRTYQYVQLLLKGSMNEYVLLRIAQTIVKIPTAKMQDRTSFCLRSSEDRKNRGKGIKKMSRSDERLTTRFVMRWFKYVAHWVFAGWIAQYWLNGRHHAAKHKVSIMMKHTVVYTAAILTRNLCSVLILRYQSVLLRQESKTISEVAIEWSIFDDMC
jgi:hypothetical protein